MNDVAVVGAGILGAFTALALQERGAKTILIERGQIALGTTSNSFAWVNATAKTGHEAYHRLNAAGVKAWHDLASEFGDRTVGLYGAGSLHWGDPEIPGSLEGHRNRVAALRAFDYPVFELSRRDLQALEPDIRFGEDAEGLMAWQRGDRRRGRCRAADRPCRRDWPQRRSPERSTRTDC